MGKMDLLERRIAEGQMSLDSALVISLILCNLLEVIRNHKQRIGSQILYLSLELEMGIISVEG